MTSYTHEYLVIPDYLLDFIDLAIISYPHFLLEIHGINGKKLYQLDNETTALDAMETYAFPSELTY